MAGDTIDRADWQNIRASLNGDGEAFARLVQRYQSEMAAYLWHFARQREICEELVQNVFVEAYFSLHGYRGDAPFSHWLRRIATRVGYRYWKERARQRERPETTLADWDRLQAAEDPPDPAAAAELLHGLLARLAPRDRLVLTLTYLEGRSVAETAALTGWTQTMVKVQAHRARKRLRKLFEEIGHERERQT